LGALLKQSFNRCGLAKKSELGTFPGSMYFRPALLLCALDQLAQKGGLVHKVLRSQLFGSALLGALFAGAPASAVMVDVNLYGTVVSGTSTGGQNFANRTVRVGFSYDTATVGVGGVFSGGVNFLNPFLEMNGVRYVNFADQLAHDHPTTVTLVNGAPDTLAVDFDVTGYVGITNKSESLTLNFAGASDFLTGVSALPSAVNVLDAGTSAGSFGLLYADDCQNYACGPDGVFFSFASFTLDRLLIGVSPVPEPASYLMWVLAGVGLLVRGRGLCRRAV
jgi:hypothetical protein